MPTLEKAVSNNRFLRNDNTWQDVTPGNIGAYSITETNAQITAAINNLFIVDIVQSAKQTITVNCNGRDHTTTFIAPAGASYTATISANSGYTAGVLSSGSGTVTNDMTISASAARSNGGGGGDPGAGGSGGH